MIEPIPLDGCAPVGHGLNRPETVLVMEGRVLVSDATDAAVTEILPDGTLRGIGHAPGETNGLSPYGERSIVFTTFAEQGRVCVLDLDSEEVTVLGGTDTDPLPWPNFPITGSGGTTWVSCTTSSDPFTSLGDVLHDGSIVRIDAAGQRAEAATGLPFPNCMTFDAAEEYLYVVRSTLSDIARYRVEPNGDLTDAGRCGPVLGQRGDDERGEEYQQALFNPEIGRRWALTDGCAFDAEGNLWVTLMSANRIVAITPEEEVVTVLDDPEGKLLAFPTSIAWGGPDLADLYIGSLLTPYVVKAPSPVPGRPLRPSGRS